MKFKIFKRILATIMLIAMPLVSLTGCYACSEVNGNQIGLVKGDGLTIEEVVGAGRYTDMDVWASPEVIDIAAKTMEFPVVDAWSNDKQSLTIYIALTYKRDRSMIEDMWQTFKKEALNDADLQALVASRVPGAVKEITTTMTLDEMIGVDETSERNREYLRTQIRDKLSELLKSCYVEVVDLFVNDIEVDPNYKEKLNEKALSRINLELLQQKTKESEEQVKQEEAKTLVDLEIARRANLVAEEENKIFQQVPEAYEIKKLEIMRDILKSTDKVYFVPAGTDISLWITGENGTTQDARSVLNTGE